MPACMHLRGFGQFIVTLAHVLVCALYGCGTVHGWAATHLEAGWLDGCNNWPAVWMAG